MRLVGVCDTFETIKYKETTLINQKVRKTGYFANGGHCVQLNFTNAIKYDMESFSTTVRCD